MCEQQLSVDPVVGLVFLVLVLLVTSAVLVMLIQMSRKISCMYGFMLPLLSALLVLLVLWPAYYVVEWAYLSTYGYDTRATITRMYRTSDARALFPYRVDYQYTVPHEDNTFCSIQTSRVATLRERYTSLKPGDTIAIRYSRLNPHASMAEYRGDIVVEGMRMYGVILILIVIAMVIIIALEKRRERLNFG